MAFKTLELVRNLWQFFRATGLQFNGNRDIYQAYGYQRFIRHVDMRGRWIRQDIARRVVNAPADAVWSDPPQIQGLGNFQSTFDDFVQTLNLWNVCNRADKLAGMGDYATILVGINDGKKLSEPVTPSQTNKIIYFQPYSVDALKIEALELDPTSPRFGKPLMYALKQLQLVNSGPDEIQRVNTGPAFQVHYTRVIHIAEDVLEDEFMGHPRLALVYNLMDDFLKVVGGSAEIYWLNGRGGLQIDVDKDMALDPEDEHSLGEEVDDYVNNIRRVMRTRGVKMNPMNHQLADPRSTYNILISTLAIATGIPQRILMGAEAGQLASAQDRANWAEVIGQRRDSFAEPQVVWPLLRMCIAIGVLNKDALLNVIIDWPEAFHMNPLERAQTSAQQARSAANFSKVLQTTPELMDQDNMRDIIGLAAPAGIVPKGHKATTYIRPGKGKTAPVVAPGFGGGGGS